MIGKTNVIYFILWQRLCCIHGRKLYTVIPRFSAPGRLLIQTVLEGALIRGGRLYEGGAYFKMLINEGSLICIRIKLINKW